MRRSRGGRRDRSRGLLRREEDPRAPEQEQHARAAADRREAHGAAEADLDPGLPHVDDVVALESGLLTEMSVLRYRVSMQTTLRIDDAIYREAKAEAARLGITLTRFIEDALRQRIARSHKDEANGQSEARERDRLMESLLRRTAHFRVGRKPTRREMNER